MRDTAVYRPRRRSASSGLVFARVNVRPGAPMQVFVVGSFVVACSVKVARLPRAGESLAASAFVAEPGGKGFNLALALHRLGRRSTALSRSARTCSPRSPASAFERGGPSDPYAGCPRGGRRAPASRSSTIRRELPRRQPRRQSPSRGRDVAGAARLAPGPVPATFESPDAAIREAFRAGPRSRGHDPAQPVAEPAARSRDPGRLRDPRGQRDRGGGSRLLAGRERQRRHRDRRRRPPADARRHARIRGRGRLSARDAAPAASAPSAFPSSTRSARATPSRQGSRRGCSEACRSKPPCGAPAPAAPSRRLITGPSAPSRRPAGCGPVPGRPWPRAPRPGYPAAPDTDTGRSH